MSLFIDPQSITRAFDDTGIKLLAVGLVAFILLMAVCG